MADETEQPRDLRRIARLFRPYRGRLAAVLALIVVSAALGMTSPFLLREVLDDAIPNGDTTLLTWLVLGMIGVSVVTGALSVARHASPGCRNLGGGGSILVAGRIAGSWPSRFASSTTSRSPVGKSIRPKL